MERNRIIESWVHQYADRLAFIAYSHIHDQKTAEDIVQETFTRALRSIHQLRDTENPLPWLIRIVINLCHSAKRKGWNEIVVDESQLQVITTGPEDIYLKRTQDDEVHQAIMSLPENYRIPIILFYFEELPTFEIATALSIREGTVRARLARGRKKLELMLERGLDNEKHSAGRAIAQRETRLHSCK